MPTKATKNRTQKQPETSTLSLPDAMATNDLRVQLESLRDRLAAELVTLSGRDVAPVARQLTLVCVELAALPQRERSTLDDLAERRRARREARVPSSSGGSVNGG